MATPEQILEANRATFAAWNAHDPGGLVVEDVNFWDIAALMAQLGVTA